METGRVNYKILKRGEWSATRQGKLKRRERGVTVYVVGRRRKRKSRKDRIGSEINVKEITKSREAKTSSKRNE